MGSILDDVGTTLGAFSWSSMGNIVWIATIILVSMFLFAIIFFVMYWKSFNYSVRIYEPQGQVTLSKAEEEAIRLEAKQGKSKTLQDKDIKFDMINIKKTHGKYITKKGSPFFKTFVPFRDHESVPMEYMYNDGIHLLRLSRDIFIPIPKPETLINVGKGISISVTDDNRWKVWSNLMADKVNTKYQDLDALKRTTLYFIIGIVSLVLVGGFILWLIYSSVNKGWDASDKFSAAVAGLTGGGKPL